MSNSGGLQRGGPQVRPPVDTLIRRSLERTGATFAIVSGRGEDRIARALGIVQHVLDEPGRLERAAAGPRWRWFCDHCDDAYCRRDDPGG